MPRREDIKHVLVIGSGPIVIGQACEFDYSGTQACRVLREEGVRVILVNSNPATIMTDPDFADATYIEPITPAVIETITPRLIARGVRPLIITNDVVTTEDAKQVRHTLNGILVEEKIVGVETGACPHTAIRDDVTANAIAVEDLEADHPGLEIVLIESGGDNLTATFSPALDRKSVV